MDPVQQIHVDMKRREGKWKKKTYGKLAEDVTGLECQHQSAIVVQMVLHNCTSTS